jgi:cell division protein FtsB
MLRRFIPALLIGLLLILHAQLWLGRGSVAHVSQLQARLAELNQENKQAQRANEQLSAELRDLREGLEMVEERARAELGMIKPNEVLVQYAK